MVPKRNHDVKSENESRDNFRKFSHGQGRRGDNSDVIAQMFSTRLPYSPHRSAPCSTNAAPSCQRAERPDVTSKSCECKMGLRKGQTHKQIFFENNSVK